MKHLAFSADDDTEDVLETTLAAKSNPGTTQRAPNTPAASHADLTSEYNALRNQYRKAKAPLALAEAQFNSLVVEAQKEKSSTSIDDVKRNSTRLRHAPSSARPDFETAHRQLKTKLELLTLDLKSAALALDAAKAKLLERTELHNQNAASLSDVNQQRTAVDAADLDFERVSRLITLFDVTDREAMYTAGVLSEEFRLEAVL